MNYLEQFAKFVVDHQVASKYFFDFGRRYKTVRKFDFRVHGQHTSLVSQFRYIVKSQNALNQSVDVVQFL